MAVFNNPGYYHALDSTYAPEELGPAPPITMEDGTEWTTSLGPKELGTSANPFQHQTQGLVAKIREGASRVELEFPGAGKSSSQAPSPESYGARDRLDMRELAKVAGVKTTTHATFQRTGFSGFTERGFSDEARYQNLKEVRKAIEFAAEATTGGAVVFHTGEWQRPIVETWGKGKDKVHPEAAFRGFEEEDKRAAFYLVDERTGEFVSAIRKDKELFRPKYKTAADIEKEQGRKLVGQYDGQKKGVIEPEDFVDINGKYIDEKDPNRLFERVPVWDKEHTKFEVEKYDWDKIVKETGKWNERHPEKQKTPAEMFIQIEVENQILQAKGHSLFYAQRYDEENWTAKKLREALEFYRNLDKSLPESEKWKLMTQRGLRGYLRGGEFTTPETMSIPDLLEKELKQVQDTMRPTHEASASADAQAKEREELLTNIKTVDEYGLQKSTEGIARAGLYAYEQTMKHKKELDEPVYVAPENWQAQMYGSHPDELVSLVNGARQKMAEELMKMRGKDAEEAKKIAATHIKSTIDIGHLNLWRQHFVARPGESDASRNKRFNEWAVQKTKEMIDAGIVGHVHVADNLGWDDEHLIPGEGNAPIREFVKELEKAGVKDFIIEPGSFHPVRTLPDTLRHLGSPIYAAGTPFARPMGQFWQAHFGYSAPSMYIVGAYSPSNEWRLWSEVPLE
jgi:sugar phosphate isomerase/epimerase